MATRSTNKRGSSRSESESSGSDIEGPVRQRLKRVHDVQEGDGDDFFLYTGQHRSAVPRGVIRVRIDPTVSIIGKRAFKGCGNLEEVTFRRGGNLRVIEKHAFAQCTSLSCIEIPATVTRIGWKTFFGCFGLEEVEFCDHSELNVIGGEAFRKCTSLKSINIPPEVKVIPMRCFSECYGLKEVIFNEGLRSLESHSFVECKSLNYVRFPSTVKMICCDSFEYCNHLSNVDFNEELETIDGPLRARFWEWNGAFRGCSSLERIRVPTSVDYLGMRSFSQCENLIGVEYPPEFVQGKGGSSFEMCTSLRNVVIPPNSEGYCRFKFCYDLLSLFGTSQNIEIAMKNRFKSLPVHKICYYQSHHPKDYVMEQLRCSIARTSESFAGLQDCVGMTPLHLLAISANHDVDIYEFIVSTQPESIIIADKWGCIPMVYAILGKVPNPIIQLLIHSHKSAFPNTRLNWEGMVKSLCRADASIDTIKNLVETQQAFYPTDTIDWQKVAPELVINCMLRIAPIELGDFDWSSRSVMLTTQLSDFYSDWGETMAAFSASPVQAFFPHLNGTTWQAWCERVVCPLHGLRSTNNHRFYDSLMKVGFLTRYNITERLKSIGGMKEWQHQVFDLLKKIPNCRNFATLLDNIIAKIVLCEQKYHELKDATSMLELALWKMKIDETTLDDDDTRKSCRVNSGSDEVIANVLPYLIDRGLVGKRSIDGGDGYYIGATQPLYEPPPATPPSTPPAVAPSPATTDWSDSDASTESDDSSASQA